MARTKTSTRDDTKTLTTSLRNRHLENIYFCVFKSQISTIDKKQRSVRQRRGRTDVEHYLLHLM